MRVLIVGAGIGGLTLANALEQAGLSPVVVEIAATLQPHGLGLALMPNGMRALERIGLAEPIAASASPVERSVTLAPNGVQVSAMDFAPSARRFGPTVGVHRNALLDALTARLRCEIRLGTTVRSLRQTPRGVDIELEDGSGHDVDLVVGADGLHSTLGPRIFGDDALHYRHYRAWRAVLAREASDPAHTIFRVGPGFFCGTFPVGEKHYYLFALEHGADDPAAAEDGRGQIQRIAGGLDEATRVLALRLEETTPVIYTPVYEVIRDSWVSGRVVLLGDAAHAIVPFQAQGASQAIEDALVLARALAREHDVPTALDAYERARRPRVEEVRAICRYLGMAMGLEGRPDPDVLAEHARRAGERETAQERLWGGGVAG